MEPSVFHFWTKLLLTLLLSQHAAADLTTEYITKLTYDLLSMVWRSSSFVLSDGSLECSVAKAGSVVAFKSAVGLSYADNEYHWFVMQLVRPISLREALITGVQALPAYWIKGIELWTAPVAVNFGPEHCNSSSIRSRFIATRNQWSFCASTSTWDDGVGTARFRCIKTQKTQTILLRKYLAHIGEDRRCMGFEAIHLVRVLAKPPEPDSNQPLYSKSRSWVYGIVTFAALILATASVITACVAVNRKKKTCPMKKEEFQESPWWESELQPSRQHTRAPPKLFEDEAYYSIA